MKAQIPWKHIHSTKTLNESIYTQHKTPHWHINNTCAAETTKHTHGLQYIIHIKHTCVLHYQYTHQVKQHISQISPCSVSFCFIEIFHWDHIREKTLVYVVILKLNKFEHLKHIMHPVMQYFYLWNMF